MPDGSLIFDGDMCCGESCHDVTAVQRQPHRCEVKTVVTTQQRDGRAAIVTTNLITTSSAHEHLQRSNRCPITGDGIWSCYLTVLGTTRFSVTLRFAAVLATDPSFEFGISRRVSTWYVVGALHEFRAEICNAPREVFDIRRNGFLHPQHAHVKMLRVPHSVVSCKASRCS